MSNPIHPSKWVHPIDVTDFTNFIATPISIEPGKQHLFETKDNAEPTGHRLRAKVRMTFAGVRTRNKAVYLPDEHYKSAHTFTKDYNKPIQVHHDDNKDPIGRVIDVRYVDTTNEAISVDVRATGVMSIFKDKTSKPISRLSTVPAFLSMSANNKYRGVGHILGLWDITDPDAIRKVLDGRYLTVSTAMLPKRAYCSSCALDGELTDWSVSSCDHERGDIVDGVECVAVPVDYEWEECSVVNHPAATLAQIIEVGSDLSFSDALSVSSHTISTSIFEDVYIVDKTQSIRLQDGHSVSDLDVFKWDISSKDSNTPTNTANNVIGVKKPGRGPEIKGQTMKLTDLIKDTASNYEAIAKHLNGAARLTGDLLKDLDDSVFIGPNRTFPAHDLAHLEAIKSLLSEIEDSDSKATLLASVEDKIASLTEVVADQAAASTGDEVEAGAEGTVADAAPSAVSITADELEALKAEAAKVQDLTLDRDLWRQKALALKEDSKVLSAVHSDTLKAYKGLLAEALLNAQVARGFDIKDKSEALKKFTDRSVESLTTSLSDFASQAESGTSRKPSGERVANPLTDETEVKTGKYAGIVSRYYDMFYGPEGPRGAQSFFADAVAKGLIPANIKL